MTFLARAMIILFSCGLAACARKVVMDPDKAYLANDRQWTILTRPPSPLPAAPPAASGPKPEERPAPKKKKPPREKWSPPPKR